jgi:hypothetical protein
VNELRATYPALTCPIYSVYVRGLVKEYTVVSRMLVLE